MGKFDEAEKFILPFKNENDKDIKKFLLLSDLQKGNEISAAIILRDLYFLDKVAVEIS
ncbi:MAG: hypothetical protein QW153_01795 [Candidatus Bilamarchaeaceae archaeon]